MPKVLSWSDGRSGECELVVRNEQPGFALYWSEVHQPEPDRYITPALGYCDGSRLHRREWQAIAQGKKLFGEVARRCRS